MEYFLNEMKDYEVSMLLDNLAYLDMNAWEQTRSIVYSIAQANSTKKLKASDVMKFEWDKHTAKKQDDKNTIMKGLRKAKEYAQKINDNNKQTI